MILEQQFNFNDQLQDVTIHIMVDYLPDTGVNDLLNISITDHSNGGINIVLSDIMNHYFSNQMEEMIDSVNWYELYRQKKIEYSNPEY
tara:strand:- start:499 stop:762 length:264 start_codon:yes stop_codon:yes gene_type:complete